MGAAEAAEVSLAMRGVLEGPSDTRMGFIEVIGSGVALVPCDGNPEPCGQRRSLRASWCLCQLCVSKAYESILPTILTALVEDHLDALIGSLRHHDEVLIAAAVARPSKWLCVAHDACPANSRDSTCSISCTLHPLKSIRWLLVKYFKVY